MLGLAAAKAGVLAAMAGLSGLAIFGGLLPAEPPAELEMIRVGVISAARYEVSWQAWKRCHEDGDCSFLPNPGLRDRGADFPVTGVNHLDVRDYIGWLNTRTGKRYRLPTAAEWRLLATENAQPVRKKLFSDPRLAWAADYGSVERISARVEPTGHFGSTSAGISDLAGNVWEWTSSCAMKGFDEATCPAFLVEGLHETNLSIFVRDSMAGGCAAGVPPANIGFRLVEDL